MRHREKKIENRTKKAISKSKKEKIKKLKGNINLS